MRPLRIVTARRISQVFFTALFVWLCVVATVGDEWFRLRGWPVDFFLNLDPLTALAAGLAARAVPEGLAPALFTLAATLFMGRVFCGFVCPLGALNQFVGWISRRAKSKEKREARLAANAPRPAPRLKYLVLAFLLTAAAFGSLQTGLIDPLPLLHRSVNLTLAVALDPGVLSPEPRVYESAWLIGGILLAILGLNAFTPRFFCRYLCPLGALLAVSARFAPWKIGKKSEHLKTGCGGCTMCEEYCEGGCRPSGEILTGECVMCLNCLDRCPGGRIGFSSAPSVCGEKPTADVSRRGLLLAAAAGGLMAPLWRVGGLAEAARNPALIRPPGSLDEERFLERCIRCGQCMRVCPSNIIQPALFESGVQGVWTPAVNYRAGRSGCRTTCVACGNVCPTGAIVPLVPDQKTGTRDFAAAGPVRMGLAFVDRTRCLPWVKDRPCIVCQELCPVSPKAIHTRVVFEVVRDCANLPVRLGAGGREAEALLRLSPGVNVTTGDYFLRPAGGFLAEPSRVLSRTGAVATLERHLPAETKAVDLLVRLQRPFVDAARCIGCGMCEQACPVAGLRAIRVYAENESRSRAGRMLA